MVNIDQVERQLDDWADHYYNGFEACDAGGPYVSTMRSSCTCCSRSSS